MLPPHTHTHTAAAPPPALSLTMVSSPRCIRSNCAVLRFITGRAHRIYQQRTKRGGGKQNKGSQRQHQVAARTVKETAGAALGGAWDQSGKEVMPDVVIRLRDSSRLCIIISHAARGCSPRQGSLRTQNRLRPHDGGHSQGISARTPHSRGGSVPYHPGTRVRAVHRQQGT